MISSESDEPEPRLSRQKGCGPFPPPPGRSYQYAYYSLSYMGIVANLIYTLYHTGWGGRGVSLSDSEAFHPLS